MTWGRQAPQKNLDLFCVPTCWSCFWLSICNLHALEEHAYNVFFSPYSLHQFATTDANSGKKKWYMTVCSWRTVLLIRNISTAGVAQWLWMSNKVPMHFCNLIFLLQAARVQGKKTKTKTDSIRLKFATSVKLLCSSVFLTMWWLTNTQLLLILENDLGSLGLPLKCCKMSRPPCVLFRHVI